MDKKRIILWGAWYGSKNVGDQALLLSITDMLGEAIEDVEFIVITADPGQVREYTKRDSAYLFHPLHSRRQFLGVIKAFFTADAFVFGGGVPFYDEVSHSLAIAILVTLSRIFRVPCVLWAVSSLRIRSMFSRLILRYVLSWASVITCRDRHTYQLFMECGIDASQQQMAADSVFNLRSNDGENAKEILARAGWYPEEPRPLIALTPRLLRGMDGEAHTHYTPKSVFDNEREMDAFSSVLDWLWENGCQPIFVPMNTVFPDDDRIASRQIMAKAKFGKNALVIDEEILSRDAANVYHYCQAAFVARVHGAITAFLGGCPILMYAFDLKHVGIMEQMGLSDYVFLPERDTPDDAIRMLSHILVSRLDLTAQMEKKHGDLQEQARVPREAVVSLLQPK